MAGISAAELAKINSFPKLVDLLRNHLEWPIEEDYGFEDVVYEYEASELGLKPDEVAKIREIHQLRPLATSQPWGIFFISFEDKALSVTVLRRILKNLILKKRAGTQASERQAWAKNDLIFAANFGNSGSRELAFVHFSDGAQSRDLPVMKVLGWNAKDTQLHNDYVGRTLAEKLRWPDDTKDLKKWREDWSSAFELRLNEAIRTSKDLALKLAGLATEIRARANELLAAETDRGPMRAMLKAFRKNLIHDLDEDGFADMFAQTIAYGMLAARISRSTGIVADNLADMVPKTNPFLKELFANFLAIGGHDKRQSLDFDELGVRDVVDMLNAANMEAVLRDFGDRNPKEDPVIHFYELFLKEYDPQKRMQRGVFYTPRPVVNFIVRGVDEILRTEFGLPLGLADNSTWAEVAAKNDRISIPHHVQPDAPFVQILDPATGTGTFLVEVIDLIHKRMKEYWKGQGKSASEIESAWNEYVPSHLLPRLTAYELMMAPYTIAHMKVGLKLSETGYGFGSDERARVFLTNALEPARDLDMEFMFMSEALAHEAQASNEAKARTPFTVVIGNPPYSLLSGNLSRSNREMVDRYKYIEGVRLQERGALQFEKIINDDCVKFYALGERIISDADVGIMSFISNNNFLDSLVLRGMRYSLLNNFNKMKIIQLGGSVKRGGLQIDENVFDIQQGVCISQLSKTQNDVSLTVQYTELAGTRDHKYDALTGGNLSTASRRTVALAGPFYFFDAKESNHGDEYNHSAALENVFGLKSIGFFSSKDDLVVSYDPGDVTDNVKEFSASDLSNQMLCDKFGIGMKKAWNVTKSRQQLKQISDVASKVIKFRNRAFDEKYVFYDRSLIWSMAWPVNQHLLDGKNIALTVSRQLAGTEWRHAFCSDSIVELCYITNKTKEGNHVFPLWLNSATGEAHRRPNIERAWAVGFGEIIGLEYEDGVPRDEQKSPSSEFRRQKADQIGQPDLVWDGHGDLQTTFGPRNVFDYMYAVLHAPSYRRRYAEFLKSDFPRIPTPATRATFAALTALGRQLVGLHLLRPEDAPVLESPEIEFRGTGEARVAKGYPEYKNGKVMINASRWFEDVPKATWEFHVGGYQVCEKWLKDRAGKGGKNPSPGRVLTEEDILHYRRIVVALTETRRLMAEIDVEIDKHGGWPDAFVTGARGN